ncbi:MAG: CDP-glucose 4,6-dehydratase [Flavobacteriales bacterium]|nr:CDP-glucose 4,6-dehydratase [Flavobacteriales bacterium]MDW8410332.1 CDP-glucose 4,6-dehydratase [Flavobacteriales bacterium]
MRDLLTTTFSGQRVLLTGHTGFKGAWLLHLLHSVQAHSYGYALPPEQEDELSATMDPHLRQPETLEDIRSGTSLSAILREFQPQFIIHMAAQSLVRRSYQNPALTFEVNVSGTLRLLEAIRQHASALTSHPLVVLIVTTDKVYENLEKGIPFRESDPLGGHDPYSASKAACELLCASYRRSFFPDPSVVCLLTARAGNVIGGGDRAPDRLIPDIIRAWQKGHAARLRYPQATRPWQHVLEPLVAYLTLLAMARQNPSTFARPWNIGPYPDQKLSVLEAAQLFAAALGAPQPLSDPSSTFHEAVYLSLNIDDICRYTLWRPQLTMQEAIEWTARWETDPRPATEKCMEQIQQYFNLWKS